VCQIWHLRFEGIVCRELQCQLVGQSLIDSCTVPLMVPIHAKMLSPSGNTEIPRTPHVWKDHSIHCIRKLGTLETRQWGEDSDRANGFLTAI
jgi:hypothetical protein